MIALQLDLARQYETPDAIRQTMRLAARWGYDTVAFHLEDRVRTAAYPHGDPAQSYDAATMRALVADAAALGLEVLPVLATLGHTERFLRHPAMRHLGEARAGGRPRLGDGWNVMCPVSDQVEAFWTTYLAELADIFPSRRFHIGCDEVWNLGMCPDCRARMQAGEDVGALFAHHVRRIHRILAGLGRETMMWEDMLEEYPAAGERLPSDLILVVWQYDQMSARTMTHFGNRARDHRLGRYARLGMRCVVAPTGWSALNAETLTAYAAGSFRPMGWLMTRWDDEDLITDAPTHAHAGRLWRHGGAGPAATRFAAAIRDGLDIADPALAAALWSRACVGRTTIERSLKRLLAGPPSAYAEEQRAAGALAATVLRSRRDQVPAGLAREVVDDQLALIEREQVQTDASEVLHRLTRAWAAGGQPAPADLDALAGLAARLDALAAHWKRRWDERRPGLPELGRGGRLHSEALRDALEAHCRAFAAGKPPFGGLLKVRYALPDFFHWPHVRWFARFAGDPAWHLVDDANPKTPFRDPSECPFYTVAIPVVDGRVPERLRLDFDGFGGVGVLHLEWFGPGRVHRPAAVVAAKGRVVDPEHLLVDDTRWTWFGPLSAHGAFGRDRDDTVHSLEIALAAGEDPVP